MPVKTVQELIDILQKLPSDLVVFTGDGGSNVLYKILPELTAIHIEREQMTLCDSDLGYCSQCERGIPTVTGVWL